MLSIVITLMLGLAAQGEHIQKTSRKITKCGLNDLKEKQIRFLPFCQLQASFDLSLCLNHQEIRFPAASSWI